MHQAKARDLLGSSEREEAEGTINCVIRSDLRNIPPSGRPCSEKNQTGESISWGLWVVNQDVGWVRTCGTLMFDCSWSHQNSCYSGIMDSITRIHLAGLRFESRSMRKSHLIKCNK
ncbi:unnamed protein product [Arctogadus glacialis]